jgi:hypothetical protein
MQTYQLHSHPDFSPHAITRVEARIIGFDDRLVRIRWRVDGSGSLIVPRYSGRGRQDELWRTTCFELFVKPEGGAEYVEINLSPSGRWAAYQFTDYRDGMSNRPASQEPEVGLRQGSTFAIFDAAIPRDVLPPMPAAMAITAILEEEGGVKSYWAMAHPEAKPDFHDPACFAATLAAPKGS